MKLNKAIKLKVASYFKQRLGLFDYRNGWMKGTCPMCQKTMKFGVNVYQNRTNCFYCNNHPDPFDLIADIEGLKGRQEVWGFLQSFEDAEYLEPSVEVLEKRDVILPESYKNITLGDSRVAQIARGYLKRRGFKIDDLAMKGIGYCARGDYKHHIIIPYYQGNKLIYFTARRFIGGGIKFKNPSLEDFGMGKSMLIYNVDCVAIYNKIRLVESATNALTLGDNSCAIGGKVLSSYQLSIIVRSPVKRVEIILDPDAYAYALKAALTLIMHKKVKVTLLPEGTDVNDIGKKATNKLSKLRPWYTNYNDVYKEFLNCEKGAQYTYNRG